MVLIKSNGLEFTAKKSPMKQDLTKHLSDLVILFKWEKIQIFHQRINPRPAIHSLQEALWYLTQPPT
jgi:hypothetical protein